MRRNDDGPTKAKSTVSVIKNKTALDSSWISSRMWNAEIQFKISSWQKAFFEQYSWTLNTHSIYHKESILLWQLLDFSTNHLPPSDSSLPRLLPAILSTPLKQQTWFKIPPLCWMMFVSVWSYSSLARVSFSDGCVANGLSAAGHKAITTSSPFQLAHS